MNHIRYEEDISWCGAFLDRAFHFRSLEQVTINNRHGERLVCQYCLRAVIIELATIPPAAQHPNMQLTESAQECILGGYGGTKL